MFGTIARLRVRPGTLETLKEVMAGDDQVTISGWVADFVFQSKSDPEVCYLVAFFRDETSYAVNADSPEQHERYLRFRACLSEDPEWNDGQVISATGPGAHLALGT
jgi:hypothetical protein